MFKKFRRDRDFYKSVLVVAVPIMIQNGITNFVSLLDNLMVGQVGTLQMSGVSIINQLMFVFNLTVFGGLAGAGIFASQFFGKSDYDGVKRTIRFKMYMSIILLLVAAFVFINFDTQLIGIYLKGGKNPEDVARTLAYGKEYLKVMLVGLVPFALTQIFASTLRECGETALPMKAGITAIGVNLVFNYLLIFGKFGVPEMGILGAAVLFGKEKYRQISGPYKYFQPCGYRRHSHKTDYRQGLSAFGKRNAVVGRSFSGHTGLFHQGS